MVYQVAKALPKEEQERLFEMLQEELVVKTFKINKSKSSVLSKEQAIKYLLKNVFSKTNLKNF